MEPFRGSLLNNVNSVMAESSLCSSCGDIKVRQVEQWGLFSSHFVHCSRFIWQKVAISDIITVSFKLQCEVQNPHESFFACMKHISL